MASFANAATLGAAVPAIMPRFPVRSREDEPEPANLHAQLRIIASFALRSSIPGIPDATTLGKPELDQITVERPVAAAPGTPPVIQNILSMALAKALRDRKVVTWAAENDVIMTPKTPQETEALVARERVFFERWKKYLLKV